MSSILSAIARHYSRLSTIALLLEWRRSHSRVSCFRVGAPYRLILDFCICSSRALSSSGADIWLSFSRAAFTSSLRFNFK